MAQRVSIMETLDADKAKVRLSELLDRVAEGGRITITRHGIPVAELVPPIIPHRVAPRDVVAAFRTARQGLRLDGLSLRDLIDEGRR